MLHVGFIGACIAFHVATGCLGWVGRLVPASLPTELLDPFWTVLQGTIGSIIALAIALGLAAWRGRPHVPVLLPFVSPLVAFSLLAMPARLAPAPYGVTLAMVSSTAGGLGWLACVWVWSRRAVAN